MIKEMIGIPYVEDGRDERGVDCFGFICLYYKKVLGIEVPDYKSDIFSKCWEKIDNPEIHSLITFWINKPDIVEHLGIYLSDDYFINARKKVNSCIERLSESYWKRRLMGFYRWKQ